MMKRMIEIGMILAAVLGAAAAFFRHRKYHF